MRLHCWWCLARHSGRFVVYGRLWSWWRRRRWCACCAPPSDSLVGQAIIRRNAFYTQLRALRDEVREMAGTVKG